ncbi:uncharacterized protein LOC123498121 isoform X2 [Portunus trituberculatus]|uniref:uncharacterized protein LOC123498121 isoform X2 n=1 Tax=Portunus trituberculatus TaxID=210409 RepID=UPI001E1CCBFD|nr:uncharacterized protein LOC123498121 isoform X2 [Portunus trituberculatus]
MAQLTSLKNIKPSRLPSRLVCRVTAMQLEEGFLVLRVEDNTKTKDLFRKFRLDSIKKEICQKDWQIDVWLPSSQKVDILVRCAGNEIVPHLKIRAIVCLTELECRAVPLGTPLGTADVVHELFLDNSTGDKLRVIPCTDFEFCVKERMDLVPVIDGRAFVGTIELDKIRNGLCFFLLCEVVNVSREDSTGHMVLRVRDATNTKIVTKKYDLDNLNQNNGKPSVDRIHSEAVDIWVTSPPENMNNLNNRIIELGLIRCEEVSRIYVGQKWRPMHILTADASLPSFLLKLLEDGLRCCKTIRRNISDRDEKRKRQDENERRDP